MLCCDGEGGLSNEVAKERLAARAAELRVRAPGQHATTIEARSGILRMTLHLIEEDMKRASVPFNFTRILADAIFACNAFTFYNGSSPCNALTGLLPAMLPDLETPDFDAVQTSGGEREDMIRRSSTDAITQATAVAKANRALRARTSVDGARMYREGDMVEYH